MAKRRFSSRLVGNEITMCGYRVLTSAKYTTIMIAKLAVTCGLGSSLEWMIWSWEGNRYGMVLDQDEIFYSYVIYSNPFVDHTL
jgi:hypothetical protein